MAVTCEDEAVGSPADVDVRAIVGESKGVTGPLLEHGVEDFWIDAVVQRWQGSRWRIGEGGERLNHAGTHRRLFGLRNVDFVGHVRVPSFP